MQSETSEPALDDSLTTIKNIKDFSLHYFEDEERHDRNDMPSL
jgi:hypothetical protein